MVMWGTGEKLLNIDIHSSIVVGSYTPYAVVILTGGSPNKEQVRMGGV